jgi:lipoyl(octanoyl) transferase
MLKGSLARDTFQRKTEWRREVAPVRYESAVAFMEEKVRLIRERGEEALVWLLEHPPLYTAGTSANPKDLKNPVFPVYLSGRGGQYTYHGPGQRIAYVMLDLQQRHSDLRRYICDLEQWIIISLEAFGIKGERRPERIGIWVSGKDGREAKIAAIGVRVRKWVAYHGVSVNLNPDLSHYDGIVPCGINDYGVTSLHELGVRASMGELDEALRRGWERVFGPVA